MNEDFAGRLARTLYRRSNPFMGKFEEQAEGFQLYYIERARDVMQDIELAGLKVVEGEKDVIRSTGRRDPPDGG